MSGLLAGKRALVTGGSRGLGRAICVKFAQEGASVAFTCSTGGGQETYHDLRVAGLTDAQTKAKMASVTDAAAMQAVVTEIEKDWGGIDVLVNNAGVSQNLPLPLIDEADFDHVMSVNVKGTFISSKAVLRGMMRRKSGVILNIGSLVGVRALDAPVHYAASKAAIVGLTMAMSKEVGRHNIRVNCLAPGLLDEGMGKNIPEHRLADFIRHCALGRAGTLEEVAGLAAFLVSDKATFVTGETIVVDGGL